MSIKTYSELIRIPTFEERIRYLKLDGKVGGETFGADRIFNQQFYHSSREWKHSKREVIIRDRGCDLGCEGYEIFGPVIVHHMNPITIEDIETASDFLLDPEYLITTVLKTHNIIHYGDVNLVRKTLTERSPNDTIPWRTKT